MNSSFFSSLYQSFSGSNWYQQISCSQCRFLSTEEYKLNQEKKTSIKDCPHELVSLVFSFLPISDVKSVSLVNKEWHRLINDNEIWKLFFSKVFTEPINEKELERTNSIYKELFIKTLKNALQANLKRQNRRIKGGERKHFQLLPNPADFAKLKINLSHPDGKVIGKLIEKSQKNSHVFIELGLRSIVYQ